MIPLCRKWGLLGVAGSILIVTLLGNVLPINWYYCKRIGLDVRRFWRRIAQLLPSMLLPAIVAVLIAVSLRWAVICRSLCGAACSWPSMPEVCGSSA